MPFPSWTWTFWTKGLGMSNRLLEKGEVIAAGMCHINFVEVEGEQHQYLGREHLRCQDEQRRELSSWRKMLSCGSPELFCLHALQFNWLLGLPSSVRQLWLQFDHHYPQSYWEIYQKLQRRTPAAKLTQKNPSALPDVFPNLIPIAMTHFTEWTNAIWLVEWRNKTDWITALKLAFQKMRARFNYST